MHAVSAMSEVADPLSEPLKVLAVPVASLALVTLLSAIFPVVTALGWMVTTPVPVLIVASPEAVKPPNAPVLYWIWPLVPPAAWPIYCRTNLVEAARPSLVPWGAVGTMQFGFLSPRP
ncbi:hypothetical protein [Bradyrhizobium sp. UFLA05-112]